MNTYLDHVIAAIGLVMELQDTSHLRPETRLDDDLGFDSGLYIELIMNLEDRLPGLRIDPAFLRREDFINIASVARFVGGRL